MATVSNIREGVEEAPEEMPEYPMTRESRRRINPIDITPKVQMFALGCLTLILLTLISTVGGA